MASALIPEVLWAQRSSASDDAKNLVYLTINAAEITPESCKCEITSTKISFSGTNNKGVCYAVELELYGEIVPEESKKHITSRGAELVLRKKEKKAEYWPRLLKESKRMHFLKTNFDKWVDEDEQDEKDGPDFGDGEFGGMGGMDMGGMGGMDMGGMGGLDFSKLAASQGLGDSSDMPTGTGEGSDDEDEDMPGLESSESTKPNAGIEEVTEEKE
ncbi:HSP20-like chaperone [Tirmania nivea]|nr:HSP20-like chaperone [Tirmania nivea]